MLLRRARARGPADETVTRPEVSRCRRPAEAPNGSPLGEHQVLQVLAHRRRVAEVVVLLDERVDEPLRGRAPYLSQLDRTDLRERPLDGRLVHLHERWRVPDRRAPPAPPPRWRQHDVVGSMEGQHEPTAHGIAGRAVGLLPLPRLTHQQRQCPPTRLRVALDQLAKKDHVIDTDLTTAIPQHAFHARLYSTAEDRTQVVCLSPARCSGQTAPLWRCACAIRITTDEQHLQLMRQHLVLHFAASSRPVAKLSFRQPFLAQPEPLAVVRQDLDGRRPSIPEHEQSTRERIRCQHLAAHPSQAVDALAKVRRLHRHQDPHLRRQLHHVRRPHNAAAMPAMSTHSGPVTSMATLRPSSPSRRTDVRHAPHIRLTSTSTNSADGGPPLSTMPSRTATSCSSRLAFSRSALATGATPAMRANFAASSQIRAGMRFPGPPRRLRHASSLRAVPASSSLSQSSTMPSLLAGGEGTKCHASPHTRLPKGHGDPTGANAAETRSGEVGASSGASSQCHDVTPRVKLARFRELSASVRESWPMASVC